MVMKQIGANIASLAGCNLYDAIKDIHELNFQTIELLSFEGARHSQGDVPGFWFDRMTVSEKEKLKKYLKDFDDITVHAPFFDAPLFTHNEYIKTEVIRQIEESIAAASFIGASVVTIHPNKKKSYEQQEYWDEMINTFRSLGNCALKYGVRIAIENMFYLDNKLITRGVPDTPDDYIRLIEEINHDAVGANIDVGHFFGYVEPEIRCTNEGVSIYNEILMKVVTELSKKIYHCHLHDLRRTDWREHRAVIGKGIIDFERLFRYLKKTNYLGLMTLELEEKQKEEALIESREYLENLLKKI